MIRLRNKEGKTHVLNDEFKFVEVCTPEGKLACLIYTDENGFMHRVDGGDESAKRYSKLFGVEFAELKDITHTIDNVT